MKTDLVILGKVREKDFVSKFGKPFKIISLLLKIITQVLQERAGCALRQCIESIGLANEPCKICFKAHSSQQML